jgi:HD-GYP domain-containing protein (c-di-GMP phosphodiesterase class II)
MAMDKKLGKKAKATTSFVESLATDASPDKEVRSDLVDLIKSFFRMLKTTIIHNLNNKATISIIEQCVSLLNKAIQSEGVISIQQSDQKIFINKTVLSAGLASYMTMRNLVDLLEMRKVGGITFSGEVTTEQMRKFLYCFKTTKKQEGKTFFDILEESMKNSGVTNITINKPLGISGASDQYVEIDRGQLAHFLYAKALIYMRKYMVNIDDPSVRILAAKKCVRTIQELVDICSEKSQYILGLVTLKYFEEFLYHHSVNVALLAIVLGQRVGLQKAELADLGLCGLFHDIGLLAPRSDQKASDNDKEHSLYGASILLKEKNISLSLMKRIVVTYEHHFDYSKTGIPENYKAFNLDLYTRIIQIVDCFDIMTSDDGVNPPELPDRALSKMMELSGKRFDPALLKVFVNTIGIYPVGSTVLLSTGEVGVVYHSNLDPAKFNKPQIKLVKNADGAMLKGQIIDLDKQDKSGQRRVIVKTVDPKSLGINVSHYLLL